MRLPQLVGLVAARGVLSPALLVPLTLLALGTLAVSCSGSGSRPPEAIADSQPPVPSVTQPVEAESPQPQPTTPSPSQPAAVVEPADTPRALPRIPRTVRVGLATDLDELWFPAAGGELRLAADGVEVAVAKALRVEPAAGKTHGGAYRLQVAALKDEGQAKGLAETLERATGESAGVVFDAGTDLYRVRVGRYTSREQAEAARVRLGQHNVHDAWVVSEEGSLEEPAFLVSRGNDRRKVAGRWLTVTSSNQGIQVLERRFRGTILLYLNDRGGMNVINRVSLANYLRGVIPREMGPKVYDDLDALKAQTVAARTYALRNLGEFESEGYDICATPRCQAYGGLNWEQELTDQAVFETEREVLVYRDALADTLYSSTCGGHTEDVEVVFPLKNEPYLRGVPCLESGVDVLESESRSLLSLPARLADIVLPPTTGGQTAVLEGRLRRLAELAGLSTPADRLASVERREVQRFIASQFDLAVDARLFTAEADTQYLLDSPLPEWSPEELRLAAHLRKSGLLSGPLDQPLDAEEIERTIFRLALFLRVLEQRDVRFLALDDRRLQVRSGGTSESIDLPRRVATYRKTEDDVTWQALRMVAGDRLTLFARGTEVLAVLQDVDADGLGYDRTSNYSSWTRFRSDRELAEQVRRRYPDLGFAGFELLGRGVSGRVREMRLLGSRGSSEIVKGLPIRWTLDIPDNLFTARRLTPPGGEPGWLFSGRGWGHGVGMCQVGAYGMGLRGHSYRDILSHYYTGLELVQLEHSD